MANVSRLDLFFFVFLWTASIIHCQQVFDDDQQAVTILPSEEIFVQLDQHLMLICRMKGPPVTRCWWEINETTPSRSLQIAIENRQHRSRRYGTCRILLKVTEHDIGRWTCYMMTDQTNQRNNATTHVSLLHRTSSPAGLVTIFMIGLLLLLSYGASLVLHKVRKFDNQQWKGTSKTVPPPASTSIISIQSRQSSQCENSADHGDDILMKTSTDPAIDRP